MITIEEIRVFQKGLKAERERRGISQTRLAQAINITQPHLSYIESGRRELTKERYELILEYFDKESQKIHPL